MAFYREDGDATSVPAAVAYAGLALFSTPVHLLAATTAD